MPHLLNQTLAINLLLCAGLPQHLPLLSSRICHFLCKDSAQDYVKALGGSNVDLLAVQYFWPPYCSEEEPANTVDKEGNIVSSDFSKLLKRIVRLAACFLGLFEACYTPGVFLQLEVI